jgi:hypothetical protein
MNVEHKVSFAPGRPAVSILILPPAPMGHFFLEDTTQDVLQALAPRGQVWGDAESMSYTQRTLDEKFPTWGFTVVLPSAPDAAAVPAVPDSALVP